jgi:anaerobic selenocysteine-containing dehydrogenase
MLDVIIKEEIYDKDFVDYWTYGFEALAERAAEMLLRKPPRLPAYRQKTSSTQLACTLPPNQLAYCGVWQSTRKPTVCKTVRQLLL